MMKTKKREIVIGEPDAPASSKQTYAIFCLRKSLKLPGGDTRKEGFTKATASAEIGRLVALKEVATRQKQAATETADLRKTASFVPSETSMSMAEIMQQISE